MHSGLLLPLVMLALASFLSTPNAQSLELVQWKRADDLAREYQAVIGEATEAYRGDCVELSDIIVWSGFHTRDVPYGSPQLQHDSSAFASESLTLRNTVHPEDFGFVRQ